MKFFFRFPQKKYQQGAALIFSLIFLLLLTIIGVTAMQSSTLQERMAGNIRDVNLAFQAAEVGLRAGETVMDGVNIPVFNATGPYRKPVTSATIAATWTGITWDSTNSTQVTTALSGINSTNNPRYVVEEVVSSAALASSGSAIDFESVQKLETPTVYRITSKGLGSTGKATVILQSTFRRHL